MRQLEEVLQKGIDQAIEERKEEEERQKKERQQKGLELTNTETRRVADILSGLVDRAKRESITFIVLRRSNERIVIRSHQIEVRFGDQRAHSVFDSADKEERITRILKLLEKCRYIVPFFQQNKPPNMKVFFK